MRGVGPRKEAKPRESNNHFRASDAFLCSLLHWERKKAYIIFSYPSPQGTSCPATVDLLHSHNAAFEAGGGKK